MNRNAFRAWLKNRTYKGKPLTSNGINTRIQNCQSIEAVFGNLEARFAEDRFESIFPQMHSRKDELAPRSENPAARVRNMANSLRHYRHFLVDQVNEASVSDWPELEALKDIFLRKATDFADFEQQDGSYWLKERKYKEGLLHSARQIATSASSDEAKGRRLLTLLSAGEGAPIRWGTRVDVEKAPPDGLAKVARAVGQVSADASDSKGLAERVEAAARMMEAVRSEHALDILAPGEILCVLTAAAGFSSPGLAAPARITKANEAAVRLTGQPVFRGGILTREELERYFDLLSRIRRVMEEDWRWRPKDLLDVQGFLWVALDPRWSEEADLGEEEEEEEMETTADLPAHPLNQILFGPPGTGKTYRTAQVAVEICNGSAPAEREALMNEYKRLRQAGRIEFTTFHQSLGYEEFVEGLRPTTDSEDSAEARPEAPTAGSASGGFRLKVAKGIFRRICELARDKLPTVAPGRALDLVGRQFFKMSLGKARDEQHIYDAAVAGGYIVLGWGGDVDWSSPVYDEYDEIYGRWQQDEPGTSGKSGNISQVWRFRSSMKKGDIVIVSHGNFRFRAIGEVVGDYEFVPGGVGGNHRRKVRWLRVLDEPMPADRIVEGQLTMASCYLIEPHRINFPALEAILYPEAAEEQEEPDRYVLIIDEINRGNVSKVLGELITLIEPDKRIGSGPNAIDVVLPYSHDPFGVPANLYIVGTMNTADRSVAQLDTALRRRFHFVEMRPRYDLPELDRIVAGVALGTLLEAINRRVEWLFDREHLIGHSFFCGIEDKAALDETMRHKIIPLLAEYFFDDWNKVRAALNDRAGLFLAREALAVPALAEDSGAPRERYVVNSEPFPDEAYAAAAEA